MRDFLKEKRYNINGTSKNFSHVYSKNLLLEV